MYHDLDSSSVLKSSLHFLKTNSTNDQFLPTFCAVQKFINDKQRKIHDNINNMDQSKLRNLLYLHEKVDTWADENKKSSKEIIKISNNGSECTYECGKIKDK
jgi:hypothetical protein